MRRSAKRPRFVVPFADDKSFTPLPDSSVGTSVNDEVKSCKMVSESVVNPFKKRSVNDILTLLDEDSEDSQKTQSCNANLFMKNKSTSSLNKAPVSSSDRVLPSGSNFSREANTSKDSAAFLSESECATTEAMPSTREIYNMNNSGKDAQPPEFATYFNVLWCKRSGKKHKKWEGDAVLIVKSRSAVLKDLEGKVIARGIGYKVKEVMSLEEGSQFFIGGKECEIQNIIPEEDYLKGKCFQGGSSVENSLPVFKTLKKFQSPCGLGLNTKLKKIVKSNFDPVKDPTALYMPKPSPLNQWECNQKQQPVVDVKVDSHLSKHLRAHQRDGIIFMYECIMGFRNFSGQGVILGDQMGLGKTLQCITLIWTLHKQGPYGGKPVLKKVLIITPSSLVKNWQSEFYKWLGKERIAVFAVGQDKKVKDFIHSNYSVLIISYEMYIRNAKALTQVKFDLVICDEGHRLKNLNIKTSEVIMNLPTKRRILLTGTPIQNDLEEFYAISEFVNPGVLGPISTFRRIYVDPVRHSQSPDCTEEEKKLGESRAVQLADIVGPFFLRRTQEVINKYLPPKTEFVVFCQPTDIQINMYEHLLQSRAVHSVLSSYGIGGDVSPLQCISVLRKICNHPTLLYKSAEKCDEDQEINNDSLLQYMHNYFPKNYVHDPFSSGKFKVVAKILHSLYNSNKREKIVLVSNFTQTLNILEDYCKMNNYSYVRLDGSTNSSVRQTIVEKFNSSFSKEFIFLLSSKAGGVGLNLIGASRLILYDIDWNPATDLQAMSRIWRDGQKKQVYIYRLVTTGSIEEKIFQRQVSKQELSGAVIETSSSSCMQFSFKELKDLFSFARNRQCLTHDSIQCKCLEQEENLDETNIAQEEISRSCQLGWLKYANQSKNTTMAELLKWKHIPGPYFGNMTMGSYLENCEDVTFLFMNKVNFVPSKA